MTVNTQNITSGPYSGNDVADTFAYGFRVDDESQLSVYETDNLGVETLLTLTTDYTVTGVGDDAGGNVVRVTGALPSGYSWYIRSNYQPTQLTAFDSQGGFFPEVHEDAIDKLTFLHQQQDDRLNRSFKLPDSYSGGASAELPTPESLRFVRWNVAADALENTQGTTSAVAADVSYDNSTSGLAADDVQAAIDEVFDGVDTLGENRSRRNILINGDFGIWQRGTNFTSSEYTSDRWETVASGNTHSVSRASFPVGGNETSPETEFYLRYDRTTTVATNTFLQQKIRGVRNFADKPYILSFYVRASSAAEIRVGFNQNFGSGGSSTVNFGTTDVAVSSSWQKKTVAVAAPSISGKTLGDRDYATVQFQLLLGEGNGNVDLALVQLEEGSSATTFDVRFHSEELALCKRFRQQWVSDANSTSTYLGVGSVLSATETRYFLPLEVEMDDVPSLVISGSGDFQSIDNGLTRDITALVISSSQSDNKHVALAGTLAGGGITGQAATLRFDATVGRYLALDAEL